MEKDTTVKVLLETPYRRLVRVEKLDDSCRGLSAVSLVKSSFVRIYEYQEKRYNCGGTVPYWHVKNEIRAVKKVIDGVERPWSVYNESNEPLEDILHTLINCAERKEG